MSAPVEVVEPTGAETMAVLKFGDREVVGRFSPDEAPKMGEQHAARRRHDPRLPSSIPRRSA